jgi:pimeloyl-ACP methyl ester carboxylesterase
MAQHAADLAQLLDDHQASEPVVVAGHSMGGFVAVVMAHLFPDKVKSLVLVDGGLPVVPQGQPGEIDVDAVLSAVIGPAIARLQMTFESRDAYRDFWRQHPAFAGDQWSHWVEEYVDYDLVGTEPELRSGVDAEAVRGDGADLITGTSLSEGLEALAHPAVLLRAERGMLDNPEPLVPEALAQQYPKVTDLGVVPDTNHYTILLSDHGGAAVADAIRKAL